ADSNLDGTVDFLDLVNLAQNYGVVDGSRQWFTADFNYDGNTDFLDLVALAQNYGSVLPGAAVASGSPASFDADWAAALAGGQVPEPSSCLVMIAVGGVWAARRRRRGRERLDTARKR